MVQHFFGGLAGRVVHQLGLEPAASARVLSASSSPLGTRGAGSISCLGKAVMQFAGLVWQGNFSWFVGSAFGATALGSWDEQFAAVAANVCWLKEGILAVSSLLLKKLRKTLSALLILQ